MFESPGKPSARVVLSRSSSWNVRNFSARNPPECRFSWPAGIGLLQNAPWPFGLIPL